MNEKHWCLDCDGYKENQMTQSLSRYNQIIIKLKHLEKPRDITHKFDHHRIGCYIYEFSANGIVIKYGMSMNESRDLGERVYRQAAHLSGWNRIADSSAGDDILEAVKRFEDHQKIFIYRNDVILTVWDLGRILNETQVKQREAQVIHDYHIAHKRMPYGNVQDYRAPLNKRVPDPVVIDNLFQWL